MANRNQAPGDNNEQDEARLEDALQLSRAIEAADLEQGNVFPGVANVSDTERIAITATPEGEETEHGRRIAHVGLTQKAGDGSYQTYMNYMVMRDGDETSTRIIKRPPFTIPSLEETFDGHDPFSAQGADAHAASVEEVANNLGTYQVAVQSGLLDPTSSEIRDLASTIDAVFPKQ